MKRTIIEVTSWSQLKELERRAGAGMAFPRTFGAAHLGTIGTEHCACLCGVAEPCGELELDVAYHYLGDVMTLLEATCIFEHAGCQVVVTGEGAAIWRDARLLKSVKFKRDFDMALKFQKTQYRARDAFALARFALDPLWSHWFSSCFEQAGWATA